MKAYGEIYNKKAEAPDFPAARGDRPFGKPARRASGILVGRSDFPFRFVKKFCRRICFQGRRSGLVCCFRMLPLRNRNKYFILLPGSGFPLNIPQTV